MKEAQDAMIALGDEQEDNNASWKLAQTRQVELINTIVNGINHIVENAPAAFESVTSGGGVRVPPFKAGGGGDIGGVLVDDPKDNRATGGPLLPGQLGLVGERGMELIKSSVPSHVFPSNETFAMMLGGEADKLSNPWERAIIGVNTPSQGSGNKIFVINIGNERLGEFILRTVSDELEVK